MRIRKALPKITLFVLLLPVACGQEHSTPVGTTAQGQTALSQQGATSPAVLPKVDESAVEGISQDPIPVPVRIDDPDRALGRILSQQIPPYDPRLAKRPVSKLQVDLFIAHFSESSSGPISTPLGPGLSLNGLDEEALKGLGLEKYDQIVGISGMGIDSPGRLTQILQTLTFLGTSGVFNLSVLRGDDVIPIAYVVRSESL
jgi:hypothetical protein